MSVRDKQTPALVQYDVLIPVYNSLKQLKACVSSVLLNSPSGTRLFLLDDASPDPGVARYANSVAARDERVHFLRFEENLGFVGNVNRGLFLSDRDVILLNSDCEVPSHWIESLDRCRRVSGAALVSPLSNNMFYLSVPNPCQSQALPPGHSVESMASLVRRVSRAEYPPIPSGIGGCLLITRAVLVSIGGLDDAFAPGYWEEFDFSKRAQLAGYSAVCCDDLFVFHEGSTSFATVADVQEIQERNLKKLEAKWPGYTEAIDSFCAEGSLRELQESVRAEIHREAFPTQPRVLHIVQTLDEPGGVQECVRHLVDELREEYQSTVAWCVPGTAGWVARDLYSRDVETFRTIQIPYGWWEISGKVEATPTETELERVERLFERLLASAHYSLIHIHHLAGWPTLRLGELAKAKNIPLVFSIYDYFPFCPDVKLLHASGVRCEKTFAEPASESCQKCVLVRRSGVFSTDEASVARFLADREKAFKKLVGLSDRVIVPSLLVADRVRMFFGEEAFSRCEVAPLIVWNQSPELGEFSQGPLEIAFVGTVLPAKGWEIFLSLARRLDPKKFRLRALGFIDDSARGQASEAGITVVGKYASQDLPRLLEGAHVVVCPFLWEETYCIVVEEARALGIVPIVSDLGAPAGRIQSGQDGYLFPPGDVNALTEIVHRLESDRLLLDSLRSAILKVSLIKRPPLADQIRRIYAALSQADAPSV